MIDEKLDKTLLDECFKDQGNEEKVAPKIDINETLNNAQEKQLYDAIINIKDKI